MKAQTTEGVWVEKKWLEGLKKERQELLKELRGEVEGMNRKGVFVIKGMPNEDAFYEYDKALQDVIKLLERKYV
jgi:hypothetical protein